jgi:hypothetical protein
LRRSPRRFRRFEPSDNRTDPPDAKVAAEPRAMLKQGVGTASKTRERPNRLAAIGVDGGGTYSSSGSGRFAVAKANLEGPSAVPQSAAHHAATYALRCARNCRAPVAGE